MLGLYVHVPFCKSKCSYCDFDSEVGDDAGGLYAQALTREAAAAAEAMAGAAVDTLFIGGGTPTALPPAALALILRTLRECFPFHSEAEITSEANPESLSLIHI